MRVRTVAMAALTVASAMVLTMAGGRGARADKGKEKLVTSGVTLEPILIGSPPKKPGKKLDTSKGYDGALNVVMDTPYQIWAAMGTYVHVAAWTPDFKPAAGAKVFMDGEILGRADKTGTFVFSVATNKDGGYGHNHNVEVVYEKKGKRYGGSVFFNAYPRTQGFESSHIFVYTDRGVYNPGQTIRIRAIAWTLTDDFEPLEHESIDLLLEDGLGRVVAGGAVETSAMGIAHLEIPLPEHAPEGRYTLKANHQRESASARLRVERFVPPVIDIQHDLGRFLTRDTEEMDVSVTLGMFGGGEFTEGTMKVTATVDGDERFAVEKKVKGKGPHEIHVGEKAMKKISDGLYEEQVVRFTITVTDEFGRTDEIKRDMRFTVNPFRVVVEMDKDQYSEGDTVRAMVRVVDLDQVPIRDEKVKLVVEGKTHWAETDDGGIAKFELTMGKANLTGQLYIEGVDSSLATMYAYYHPPRPMTSEIPQGVVKEKQDTQIVIRFPTDFVPVEKVVHADIVDQSGALIGAVLVPIKKVKGEYVARGTFPAPAWGSMLLTMFCLGRQGKDPVGLLTEGQNLPVQADRALEITMKGLPKKASPGASMSVQALVKGPDGKPVKAAAVGASIVDQAVIGMLDPLEITPGDRFFHPQLKVLSTAGSKILTWPVVSRNWGSHTYDIALPPFGFRAGGTNTQKYQYEKKKPSKPKLETSSASVKGSGINYQKKLDKAAADEDGLGGLLGSAEGSSYGVGGLGLSGAGKGGGGVGYGYGMGSASTFTKSAAPMASMDAPMGGEVAAYESSIAAGADALAMGGAAPVGNQAPSVRIVVRTNFAETSFWAPDLVAQGGQLSFSATLPDSITTQTVTLIASDDEGRVGMVREKIEVGQDIYARSDLPATLTLGDQVQVTSAVRNFTDAPVKATIGIQSDGLAVVGPAKQKVQVPVGSTAAAAFEVKPLRAGEVEYEVWTEGAGVKDIERRTIWVEPVGVPTVIRAQGTLEKGEPYRAKVHVSGEDTHMTAFLNVSFPNAVPVLQGLESMVEQPGGAIDYFSSNALVTAMAYRYLLENGKNESAISMLGMRLQALMAALLMSQNPDGGWGWHVKLLRSELGGEAVVDVPLSNPYMTAQSLEGLVEMKKAGLPVPQNAVSAALMSLVGTMGSDGLWSVDDIAFWEGKTDEVQLGISAEIFHVMAVTCSAYPSLAGQTAIAAPMETLAQQLRPLLTDPDMRDPMALSHAALGVWAWAMTRKTLDAKLQKELRASAKQLTNLRDGAYWEPSWFNAFGGTVAATAAAMELMVTLDPEAFQAQLRRSLQYILSTQESFGAWHNARGTAAAVRALLLVPPTRKEIPSTVEVLVDGKTVRKVEIDPDDPFMSAVSLRQVELTSYLPPGDHVVKVLYDGNLEAPVKLTLTRWGADQPHGAAMPGAPELKVKRTLDDVSDGQGLMVDVDLKVRFDDASVPVKLIEPVPSNATVDVASLDALVADGRIHGYDLEAGKVVLYPVPGQKKIHLGYRLEGTRQGEAVQSGTQVAPLSDPSLVVSGNTTDFVVK